jgi:hypothetical protein
MHGATLKKMKYIILRGSLNLRRLLCVVTEVKFGRLQRAGDLVRMMSHNRELWKATKGWIFTSS